MTPGGVLLAVAALAVAFVIVSTLAAVRRGGRGPGDPPASHLRVDPAGFPVLTAPRAIRQPRTLRRVAVR
jgi:hypothetical protein